MKFSNFISQCFMPNQASPSMSWPRSAYDKLDSFLAYVTARQNKELADRTHEIVQEQNGEMMRCDSPQQENFEEDSAFASPIPLGSSFARNLLRLNNSKILQSTFKPIARDLPSLPSPDSEYDTAMEHTYEDVLSGNCTVKEFFQKAPGRMYQQKNNVYNRRNLPRREKPKYKSLHLESTVGVEISKKSFLQTFLQLIYGLWLLWIKLTLKVRVPLPLLPIALILGLIYGGLQSGNDFELKRLLQDYNNRLALFEASHEQLLQNANTFFNQNHSKSDIFLRYLRNEIARHMNQSLIDFASESAGARIIRFSPNFRRSFSLKLDVLPMFSFTAPPSLIDKDEMMGRCFKLQTHDENTLVIELPKLIHVDSIAYDHSLLHQDPEKWAQAPKEMSFFGAEDIKYSTSYFPFILQTLRVKSVSSTDVKWKFLAKMEFSLVTDTKRMKIVQHSNKKSFQTYKYIKVVINNAMNNNHVCLGLFRVYGFDSSSN